MPMRKQREALIQAARILRESQSNYLINDNENENESQIGNAISLLRKLHQECIENELKTTILNLDDLKILLNAFAAFVDPDTPIYAREAERSLHRTFSSNRDVFDDRVQGFINQNYSTKTDESQDHFRLALRRASLVQRCIKAFKTNRPLHQTDDETERNDITISITSPDSKRNVRRGALHSLFGVDMESIGQIKKELTKISTWNFNIFELSRLHYNEILLIVGCACFDAQNMSSHFSIPSDTLRAFFVGIQSKYHMNPYHNAEHAADVMQSMHHFLSLGGLGTQISMRGRFSALIAAACHDVGHTGYSNNFHINTNDSLAIRYAYRSPLENLHCAVTFELLHTKECDILSTLSDVERIEVRHLIIDMILATDNKYHSIYMGKLDGILQGIEDDQAEFNNPEDQKLLLQVALHAADVSNPVKSWNIYSIWNERIMMEFYSQGDQERNLNISISFGCDRLNPIPESKMQAGFIMGIVKPVYQTLTKIPKVNLKHCLEQLEKNLKIFQDQLITSTT